MNTQLFLYCLQMTQIPFQQLPLLALEMMQAIPQKAMLPQAHWTLDNNFLLWLVCTYYDCEQLGWSLQVQHNSKPRLQKYNVNLTMAFSH